MADQLLSQADVDALVASLTKNEPAKPAPAPAAPAPSKPAAPVTAAKPVVPVTKPASPAAKPPAPSSVPAAAKPGSRPESRPEISMDVINGLNAKIANLTRQLELMGNAMQKIEILEKKVAQLESGSGNNKELQALAQRVQLVGSELKKISLNLKGTPGYGIHESFTCEKCSDHGHVAVQFRCTNCGHERWYGWWPGR